MPEYTYYFLWLCLTSDTRIAVPFRFESQHTLPPKLPPDDGQNTTLISEFFNLRIEKPIGNDRKKNTLEKSQP